MGSIITLLGSVFSLLNGLWQKYKSPEAELARLKERNKAQAEANKQEAERLKDDYARFHKIKRTDDEIADRLNKPL